MNKEAFELGCKAAFEKIDLGAPGSPLGIMSRVLGPGENFWRFWKRPITAPRRMIHSNIIKRTQGELDTSLAEARKKLSPEMQSFYKQYQSDIPRLQKQLEAKNLAPEVQASLEKSLAEAQNKMKDLDEVALGNLTVNEIKAHKIKQDMIDKLQRNLEKPSFFEAHRELLGKGILGGLGINYLIPKYKPQPYYYNLQTQGYPV